MLERVLEKGELFGKDYELKKQKQKGDDTAMTDLRSPWRDDKQQEAQPGWGLWGHQYKEKLGFGWDYEPNTIVPASNTLVTLCFTSFIYTKSRKWHDYVKKKKPKKENHNQKKTTLHFIFLL